MEKHFILAKKMLRDWFYYRLCNAADFSNRYVAKGIYSPGLYYIDLCLSWLFYNAGKYVSTPVIQYVSYNRKEWRYPGHFISTNG